MSRERKLGQRPTLDGNLMIDRLLVVVIYNTSLESRFQPVQVTPVTAGWILNKEPFEYLPLAAVKYSANRI